MEEKAADGSDNGCRSRTLRGHAETGVAMGLAQPPQQRVGVLGQLRRTRIGQDLAQKAKMPAKITAITPNWASR